MLLDGIAQDFIPKKNRASPYFRIPILYIIAVASNEDAGIIVKLVTGLDRNSLDTPLRQL